MFFVVENLDFQRAVAQGQGLLTRAPRIDHHLHSRAEAFSGWQLPPLTQVVVKQGPILPLGLGAGVPLSAPRMLPLGEAGKGHQVRSWLKTRAADLPIPSGTSRYLKANCTSKQVALRL